MSEIKTVEVKPIHDKVIRSLRDKVHSDAARAALRDADDLAELIIFHAMVRKNAEEMRKTWEM